MESNSPDPADDLEGTIPSRPRNPEVSVIIEGYNETRDLGRAVDTIEALRQQDFPNDRVEIVLVGSPDQAEAWRAHYAGDTSFWSVRTVVVDRLPYLQMKMHAASFASADILAFTDSDVFPHRTWLSSLVEGLRDGDVSVGLSLFKSATSWRWDRPTRLAASSITWGWIVGKELDPKRRLPQPVGFMDHNFALRSETLARHRYPNDFGRLCGAPLLTESLIADERRLVLQPLQRVTHYFSWLYWLRSLHFRYGYEVYMLRRMLRHYPNRWIARTKIFEPLVTLAWHVSLDVPRWFRVSRLLDVHPLRRLLLLPLVLGMSCVARTAEMVGMYCTMLDADRMRRWAETV
jgi:glycosyltransferase involved in cell wall biosynthesis